MNDVGQRLKVLEDKVKILEETLETLKNMQLSEQMEEYIQSKSKSLRMVNLINEVSDTPSLDFGKEQEKLESIQSAKRAIDYQIESALKNVGTFSDDYPDDPRYFNYELESGLIPKQRGENKSKEALAPYSGKGIRIISYNGFDSDRIIVPKEIDGYPVVSIGKSAFKNATISELILPSSLIGIMEDAFEGCKNLTKLDLPEGLLYLGDNCFANSGLDSIVFPNSIKEISSSCCSNCQELSNVVFGNKLKIISNLAFGNCSKLRRISLPEGIEEIGYCSFVSTSIKTIIFPESLREISHSIFQNDFDFGNLQITCVFLGTNTVIAGRTLETFSGVNLIYCLAGSYAQKYAREHNIPMKPLSEFTMKEHI